LIPGTPPIREYEHQLNIQLETSPFRGYEHYTLTFPYRKIP
jgi:hypothetical protein